MPAVSPGAGSGDSPVVVGKIRGVHGIRGWLRVESYTRPREKLFEYDPWLVQEGRNWRSCRPVASGSSGGALTVRLDLADSRITARELVGRDIAVRRCQMPALPAGQYYWVDLVGLRVVDGRGRELGHVAGLLETGANDVLEVRGGRGRLLIPFVRGPVVRNVDLVAGEMQVDWDPEYR